MATQVKPTPARPARAHSGGSSEKTWPPHVVTFPDEHNLEVERDFNVTEDDLEEAKEAAGDMSLEEVRAMMEKVRKTHRMDPNFPFAIIQRIDQFLDNESVLETPEKHEVLIQEMRIEAALIANNSPYAEVRAVVDNSDEPDTPVSTIRAWFIGLLLAICLAFVNQLFSIRGPSITVLANVAQLLAWPLGKALEMVLPDVGFKLAGVRHSLNPGPFNRKEHMLITIMANVAYVIPFPTLTFWTQYLPDYFAHSYAATFGFQFLAIFSTNFIGYGLAGLCRRFLVYPSYCIWPTSLVTIALNSAFHPARNPAVDAPFRRILRFSRLKLFMAVFAAMFLYYWFPGYLFVGLSSFSWITWISPRNRDLATISGFTSGLGINPWPTLDWNVLLWDGADPLTVPFFSTFNRFLGCLGSLFAVVGMWYTNTYNTGYLPINSQRIYDHFGKPYNVNKAIDLKGFFDAKKYAAYSPPFLTAGNIIRHTFYFALYTAILTYAVLYHRHHIAIAFRSLIRSVQRKFTKNSSETDSNDKDETGKEHALDVHNRLMKAYREVPEWWFMVCLVLATATGIASVAAYPTTTSPGVVFFGVLLCLIFMVPVGIVKAMTGIEVQLNVLSEFLGGSWVEGNALAMNYFKNYGYVTCARAIAFTYDLKLAHYLKIPPRQTFAAQMIATLVATLVSTGVINYQMNRLEFVCDPIKAPLGLTCPFVDSHFTASVLWGTIGPKKVWGHNGLYTETLLGFPLGAAVVVIFWYLSTKFPRWARSLHPVALLYGGTTWAPFNMSYVWPAVPIAWVSWMYAKKRFLALWSKYNYVLAAALSCGVAIAAVLIYFTLNWFPVRLDWWGNTIVAEGCEGVPCRLRTVLANTGEFFGPRVGEF